MRSAATELTSRRPTLLPRQHGGLAEGMRGWGIALAVASLLAPASAAAPGKYYDAIRSNSSGEIPFVHFRNIIRFSGFSPSAGADHVAEYIAAQVKSFGLSNVKIEHFPADGKQNFWAFRTEPSWEANQGGLWLVQPEHEMLANFSLTKTVVARISPRASITTEVVDVGQGSRPEDYVGRSVAGKFVLASGMFRGRLFQMVVLLMANIRFLVAGRYSASLGRNILRGSDQRDFDIAVVKTTPVTERVKLIFRWEIFDLLNRSNFANPSNDVSTPQHLRHD
jgi:hypothetical protein